MAASRKKTPCKWSLEEHGQLAAARLAQRFYLTPEQAHDIVWLAAPKLVSFLAQADPQDASTDAVLRHVGVAEIARLAEVDPAKTTWALLDLLPRMMQA